MTCEECKAARGAQAVPYVAHEAAMARAERTQCRLWIAILILIFLLVGSNISWMIYESQFEEATTTVEATQDGGGVNIIGGGDVDYGTDCADYQDNQTP